MADMCKDHFVLRLDFPTHDSQCSRLKEPHPMRIDVPPDLSLEKERTLQRKQKRPSRPQRWPGQLEPIAAVPVHLLRCHDWFVFEFVFLALWATASSAQRAQGWLLGGAGAQSQTCIRAHKVWAWPAASSSWAQQGPTWAWSRVKSLVYVLDREPSISSICACATSSSLLTLGSSFAWSQNFSASHVSSRSR